MFVLPIGVKIFRLQVRATLTVSYCGLWQIPPYFSHGSRGMAAGKPISWWPQTHGQGWCWFCGALLIWLKTAPNPSWGLTSSSSRLCTTCKMLRAGRQATQRSVAHGGRTQFGQRYRTDSVTGVRLSSRNSTKYRLISEKLPAGKSRSLPGNWRNSQMIWIVLPLMIRCGD